MQKFISVEVVMWPLSEMHIWHRQYCPESRGQKYGELEQGVFGDYVIKHQGFVYPVPTEIESKYAGPLQCAGVSSST
jgi:D-arabinose 1-dehydrogenase-like Zn-dependent alcohol dehydrogenase